jgi:hypothetical protein
MTRTKLVIQAVVTGLSLLNFNLSIKAVAEPAITTQSLQDTHIGPDCCVLPTLNPFQNTDTMAICPAGLQKIAGFC